ncbi:MAG: DUF3098 domain-containing protein [Cryomorphaceae bacterium]|nr:DUF3098 domain-containing protein [Flavobacteriales bacterium]
MADKENKPSKGETFALGKDNYKWLLIGIGVVILGFILMIGGGSEDPMKFNEDVFSFRRITLAPIVALIGYGIIFYAILKKKESPASSDTL